MVKNQTQLLRTLGLYLQESSWVLLIRKIYQSLLTGTERVFVSPELFCHSPLDYTKHCDRDKVYVTATQTMGTCKHLIEFLSEIKIFFKSNPLSSKNDLLSIIENSSVCLKIMDLSFLYVSGFFLMLNFLNNIHNSFCMIHLCVLE